MKFSIKKSFCLLLTIAIFLLNTFTLAATANVVNPLPTSLQNGGFESNPQSGTNTVDSFMFPEAKVPYWNTLATDHIIEIWRSNFKPLTGAAVKSHSGNFHAEINANMSGTLYQDVATTQGALYKWTVWHRGRNGTDVARLTLGGNVATDINGSNQISDALSWGLHEGYYLANSTTTRFALNDVSTSDKKPAQGNFVDDCELYKIVEPTTQTIWVSDPDPATSTIASMFVSGYTASYAPEGDYLPGEVDVFGNPVTPPNLDQTGTHLVKVKITDSAGHTAGYVISTIIVKAKLTIKYVDESGAPLKSAVVNEYSSPDPYNVIAPTTGDTLSYGGQTYDFLHIDSSSDPLSGNMSTNHSIIFVYRLTPPPPGTNRVTIQYVDENNDPIQASTITDYSTGEPYNIIPPDVGSTLTINGAIYKFIEVKAGSDPLSGRVDDDKTIVYKYELVPPTIITHTVTTNYVDQNGAPIQLPKIEIYSEGETYTIIPPPPKPGSNIVINGKTYEFVEVTPESDPLTGEVDANKVVTFEYRLLEQNTHNIVIYYEDKNGNQLIPPKNMAVNNGDSYTVTPPTPGQIFTFNGKSYRYESVKTGSDALSGISDGDKTITFIFVPVEAIPSPTTYVIPSPSFIPISDPYLPEMPITGDSSWKYIFVLSWIVMFILGALIMIKYRKDKKK